MHDETIALHGAFEADSTRAVAVPIYQTVAHDFDSAAHAGAVFDLEIPGFHYNRLNNPTVDVLERRLAALERGTAGVALSSGQAAVRYSVRNLTEIGGNIVSAPQLYGATYTYFTHVLGHEGVEVRIAADDRAESIERLIDSQTKAVFCESIGNPAGNVVDIEAVAEVAHSMGVPLIVDNTVATPLSLKPISYGADIVIHSLTKFVGGHGTTLGGIVIDGGTFPWTEHPARFPMFNQPEPAFHGVVYARDFPHCPYAVRCRTVGLRNEGATMAPLNAFLLLQGLETLAVRLERHQENARVVAEYLAQDRRVAWVRYLGFADDPYHDLAKRYLTDRFPSVLTFGPTGGYEASIRFFDSVKLFKRLVNMGDAKSLVAHPASTTHRQLDAAALTIAGVRPEMVRLSVGLEHVDDLIDDIDQALGD
ncbi:MAG TPA: O-acetylhomoserine aminocarboxypropyltransferase/cysteine synthase family protein [Acidimicrobiales bacterium]|nr:O-acetylhomoserine aminocarboxypropyltransferase/cysteine synthase family protein [Acidimicrobiales bacterium]